MSIQSVKPYYSINNKLLIYFGSIFLILILFGYFTIHAFETTLESKRLHELKSETKNLTQFLSEYDPSESLANTEKLLLDYRIRTNPIDVFITNKDSEIIYSLKPISEFHSPEILKKQFSTEINQTGTDTLICYETINSGNIKIGSVTSLFSIEEIRLHVSDDLRTAKTVMGGGLIFFLLTATIALRLIQQSIISPLKIMALNIQEVAEDNLNTRMDLVRKDEFGHISKIFNEMVERLRKNRQVIKQFNIELASRVQSEVAKSLDLEKKVSRNQRLTSLGRLVSNVAHELNNPLNTILMSSKLLEEDIEKKQNLQNVERIIRNTNRAISLIKDLTEYSWLMPIKPELMPLQPILIKTQEVFLPRCKRQNIQVKLQYRSKIKKIPLVVKNIERVFVNILQNSIDAIDTDGRINITVTDDTKMMRLDFQDTGPGINPKNIDRIYEPFYSTKEQGTGIGLFLSYEIVMNHGGDIQINNIIDPRSRLVCGTQVIVLLPITPTTNTK